MTPKLNFLTYLPAWSWLKHYRKQDIKSDLLSALIVIAMLVPQGMAYAIVAGLPPITGLYASVLPMMIYALIGGSPTLSIGPVALISMMTFATLNPLFEIGSSAYIEAACLLAILVGLISTLLGILKFGFLIRLISHPVIKSFIIASAVLIALSQLKLLLNIPLKIDNLPHFLQSFWQYKAQIHLASVFFGLCSILFLLFTPRLLQSDLVTRHLNKNWIQILVKTTPLWLIILTIFIMQYFNFQNIGIETVGAIPSGFPPITFPHWNSNLVLELLPGASMIAMVSFVESISIAQATALQNRRELNSNQELIALGLANISAGVSAAFPVTGSLSRTVVNADAGAKSPISGFLSSIFIVVVSLYFTGLFYHLPLVVLAATIMVSIWKLVDFKPFIETWHYSKADGIAMWITFFAVLFIDISSGLIIGVITTFILLLWRISRPHIAVIGQIEGTEHFRNIHRHDAITLAKIISIRVDESLSFLNINSLKEFIIQEVSKNASLQHVILNCSSVSGIDLSAAETLADINIDLGKHGIQLHLSEVKGPVMDKLQHTVLLQQLRGKVFLTHYQAVAYLKQQTQQQEQSDQVL